MSLMDEHRAYLSEMRALGTDENGTEVLVGLSADETDEYLRGLSISGAGERWLELDGRHRAAKAQIISAGNEARFARPKH